MYCKNCGRFIEDTATYCTNCGMKLDNSQNNDLKDPSSFGFAILGFLIPIVGLILFLIYENKNPKRAKSAGKGALIGFITKIVISVILVILYFVFAFSLFRNLINETDTDIFAFEEIFTEKTDEKNIDDYVDIAFGKFTVTNNGYDSDTSLEVTVTNKAEEQYTYFITIEAIDSNGVRIDTDMIFADRLNAGQQINLTAFEYVEQDRLDQFRHATFKVLEIEKYNH